MDKPPYHHGDLRNALVAAAAQAVERDGPDAVSLREIAQSLGVSRAAPYRHFADRDALLAAVAVQGFLDLKAAYEAVFAAGLEPRAAARAHAKVYLELAARRPGMFRLMFESDLLESEHPPAALIEAANAAYETLWRVVADASPGADARTVRARAVTGWATLYGYVALSRMRKLKAFMIAPMSEAEIVEAVLDRVASAESGG